MMVGADYIAPELLRALRAEIGKALAESLARLIVTNYYRC